MSAEVVLTDLEAEALSSFLAGQLNDPEVLRTSGLGARERLAVARAANKVRRAAGAR